MENLNNNKYCFNVTIKLIKVNKNNKNIHFQGAIQGPGEFAEGLVLGVRSLFGHTVGGAAGAVSKITGAMGKGLAALTFDKDYQRKRRDQLNKKAGNVQEHFARGGKGLVMVSYCVKPQKFVLFQTICRVFLMV